VEGFGEGTFRSEREGLGKLLGPLEAELMECVWACQEPVTARDVRTRSGTGTKYVTVVTVLNNLCRKGVLKRQLRGKTLMFTPSRSREDFLSSVSERVVRGLVDLSPRIAVNSFVGVLDDLPEEALAELREELANRMSAHGVDDGDE
jgi:BlaI family transcriptional regulator, penicillinase repressor